MTIQTSRTHDVHLLCCCWRRHTTSMSPPPTPQKVHDNQESRRRRRGQLIEKNRNGANHNYLRARCVNKHRARRAAGKQEARGAGAQLNFLTWEKYTQSQSQSQLCLPLRNSSFKQMRAIKFVCLLSRLRWHNLPAQVNKLLACVCTEIEF